ncbi:hypothetical protein FHT78_005255 [Rhizobium sp. BK196]|uniref:nucleotidyltransferase domain-containing protein n=1 Tax=Rhizobium sp. BK196 TaxID=2587073 RepID=UPI00160E980B|nr:nucleotidyltransferase domain-containing protein [Rhizobium sp. BK196]MBB3313463.1 hypothetical protein [Rhizobium sp. BK196]
MSAYSLARDFSEKKLSELRGALESIVPADEVVVTCGSYARREASDSSDLDFFIITETDQNHLLDDSASSVAWVDDVRKAVSDIVPIEPATGGAFSQFEQRDAMLHNIGGAADSNAKITRRMLLLLEGEWLFNQEKFKAVRRQILERYITDKITDHQLTLFLLNDIIRYYRTIAVDYEFKSFEGEKPWAIRNIKLIFSRKLLYASGLFSVGLTADLRHDLKVKRLEELFDLPALERLGEICGTARMADVKACYNRFLERLADAETRNKLIGLRKEDRNDPVFRDLKNEGHHFTRELMKLFENTFDSTHPIHRAVIF